MFEMLEREAERAAGIDPGSVPLGEVTGLWEQLDRVERLLAGAKLRLAGRMEESGEWRRRGHRSAAEHLAAVGGTTVGAARGLLDASKQLDTVPHIADAVREGRLSAQQAVAVTEAAAVAPDQQAGLLAAAGRESLTGLREHCARVRAAALPDAAARHAAVHNARHLRKRTCGDGGAELSYRSTPEEVAEIWAVAQSLADRAFRNARTSGSFDSAEAYLADGLLAMARHACAKTDQQVRAVPKDVVVRVDWDALVRGSTIHGEVCELAGLGPVPVAVVDTMITSGDAFLHAVVTRGRDVVNVAHLGRRPNAWQRSALLWHDPVCATPGCDQRARLEADHVIPWAATKITLAGLLQWQCRHHHQHKTRHDLTTIAQARAGPTDDQPA